MNASMFAGRAVSANARTAAVALAAAAFMTLVLTHISAPLAPLRVLTLAIAAFAIWAFCDEMGMTKPLNRAAFVFFAIAVIAKVQIALGLTAELAGRYYLLYAAFLLMSVLLWSVAFLHRERALKLVGAVGVIAAAFPIGAIVVGHLVVGVGAAIGVSALLAATDGSGPSDLGFVTLVERIFGLWAYVAAWLLWRGYVAASPAGAISR
ncbi:MAG TPA: hypothetical protein VGF57_08570 [Roseiarcus sp.]